MFNLLGTTPSRPGIKALKTSLVSKFQEAASQERLQKDDVRTLEGLKSLISGFGLDVHCEIELIADSRPLISISASKCKTYSEYSGPFHPVILSLYADGSYEIRVNIFDRVAWGKIEIDQLEILHDLVLKVSKHSSFRICPGLREAKYQDLILKLASLRNYFLRRGRGPLIAMWSVCDGMCQTIVVPRIARLSTAVEIAKSCHVTWTPSWSAVRRTRILRFAEVLAVNIGLTC